MGVRKFCFVCSKSICGTGIQVKHVSENTRTIHTKCLKPLLKKDLGWQLSTPSDRVSQTLATQISWGS